MTHQILRPPQKPFRLKNISRLQKRAKTVCSAAKCNSATATVDDSRVFWDESIPLCLYHAQLRLKARSYTWEGSNPTWTETKAKVTIDAS